jgi:hypothetical protein
MDELIYTEETISKVYKALLDNGIYGEKAVSIVKSIEKSGVLFREVKPKRRGRPPKTETPTEDKPVEEKFEVATEETEDAWTPKGA